jgi:hypothetical protein
VAGLWEDVKRASGRVLEVAQERSGRRLVEADELERITQAAADGAVYRKELEYVGWTILNHVGGQSYELRPESRKQLALKSLNAFISDPLGGRIVEHYVAFVLGRGVPRPACRDPEVQAVIDEAWDDRSNKRHLTSSEKLVEKARAYVIQSNLYFLYFDDGADGRVRMSSAKFDTVDDVYRHPEERARILYYVAREKQRRWNPERHAEEDVDPGTPAKTWYYEALDAFDDRDPVELLQDVELWRPPEGMLKRGRLLHVAGNKTDEMAFGVPSFRRLLRWFTAYNEILESFADRMKASARLYMKASVTGGRSGLERAGLMAVRRAGSFGQPEPVEGDASGDGEAPVAPGRLGVIGQNAGVNYEPFKIDSGAGDVASAAPIMRGQVAAGGGFPGWFLGGDPGSLAGSQSVELPVVKFIEVEQEMWARPFTVLADASISRAVEVGRLDEWREATDREREAMAAGTYQGEVDGRGRVRRDLSYDFKLPDPVKRAMGDLVSAATATATAVDPNGDFPELSRWLFAFILAEAFDVADPQKIVDEVLPLERIREMEAERREQADVAREQRRLSLQTDRQALESTTGPDGQQHPPGNPMGAKQKSAPPEKRTQQAAERRARALAAVSRRRRRVGADFGDVEAVVESQLAGLAGVSENGHGGGV